MSFKIRKATTADVELLASFNTALAEETEGKSLPQETLRAGIQALTGDASKGFYVVAEREGDAAACLMITMEWTDWRNGYFWWIQSVYVRPEHRRGGAYASLHRAVEEMARERGDVRGLRLYVDRENQIAKRAYEKLGMTHSRYDFFEVEF